MDLRGMAFPVLEEIIPDKLPGEDSPDSACLYFSLYPRP